MEDTYDISNKNILIEYLKLNDKNDMAEAVEIYCDENSGIVFNKHPAKNEKTFGDLIDYNVDASIRSEKNICSSFNSIRTNMIERLSSEIEKGIKSYSNISESSYKPAKCVGKTTEDIKMSNDSIENPMEIKTNNDKKKNTILHIDNEDSEYELITPEGPGTFLQFIGENYLYVELKNGTKHCFPANLIKYNIKYIKKHPLYTTNLNYKNMTLNHTINILNGKNNDKQQINIFPTKPPIEKDTFISFESEMEYLKNYLKEDDQNEQDKQNEEINKRDYQIHLYAKQKALMNKNDEMLYMKNPACNPIKKNIYMHSVMNEYKIQKVTPYEMINETVNVESEEPQNKLCC